MKTTYLIVFLIIAFFIETQVSFAQKIITGTVTDLSGELIPGANVWLKGYSYVGTITDLNGH